VLATGGKNSAHLQESTIERQVNRELRNMAERLPDESQLTTGQLRAARHEMEQILLGKRVVPVNERQQLIQDVHQRGHFATHGILHTLLEDHQLFWPGMRQDIDKVVSTCPECLRYNTAIRGFHPLKSITANLPCEWLQIDTLIGLPPTPSGYLYLLVVIDIMTSFVWLRPLRTKDASEVAEALFKIFSEFGFPSVLQSDGGGEFRNTLLEILGQKLGFTLRFGSTDHHGSQGKVERAIRTIQACLKKLLHGAPEWDKWLPLVQMNYNATVKALTKSSPFTLMFARVFQATDDHSGEVFTEDTLEEDIQTWLLQQQQLLQVVYPSVSQTIKIKQRKYQKRVDRKRRIRDAPFKIGQFVMVRTLRQGSKMEAIFEGPYIVSSCTDTGAYVLVDDTGVVLNRSVVCEDLKPMDSDSESDRPAFFAIKAVLDHRGDSPSYQYLVSWHGYPDSENSWIPAEQFNDQQYIRDYWASRQSSASSASSSASSSSSRASPSAARSSILSLSPSISLSSYSSPSSSASSSSSLSSSSSASSTSSLSSGVIADESIRRSLRVRQPRQHR